MDNKLKISAPRYQQIAADIAFKIVEKFYDVGDKVYARSSLASQYGVSSETARRAICVLSDLKIVDATRGSGVVIQSYENAVQFIRQYQDIQTVNDLKEEIMGSVERQRKEIDNFNGCLETLIDKIERTRSINPFIPFQIFITSSTPFLNQSISNVNFWHNTSATIIAIKRNETLIMSPGPYAVFTEDDTFYFVGDDASPDRVKKFLYPEN